MGYDESDAAAGEPRFWNPPMQGQLSEHPLAELIHEISTFKLSGVMRARRERVKAAIYADDGRIVLASCNLRATRLLESLRRWNALDAAGWHKVEGLLSMPDAASDDKLAGLLVRHRVLDENAAGVLRGRLTQEVLRLVLPWRDGEWEFDARVRLEEASRVNVNVAQLLIEAARTMPDEFIARRFADTTEHIQSTGTAGSEVELSPSEGFVLSRAPLAVGELLHISALESGRARAALYTLVTGGLLTRERPLRTLTCEPDDPRRSVAPVARVPTVAANHDAEKRSRPAEETEADRMNALFARGGAADHYAALGVSRDAPLDEIKAAYYALAKRFHPDVFGRETTTPEMRAKIEAAFALISTAYETLKNTDARSKYDLKLNARTPTATAPPPPSQPTEVKREPHINAPPMQNLSPVARAAASFDEALIAEKAGDKSLALKRFSEAAQLAPQEACYRAHYGRALAAEQGTRRQAEAELVAAVRYAPANASIRIMLASFYRDVGLRLRALGEIERALEAEPSNQEARRLQRELQREP